MSRRRKIKFWCNLSTKEDNYIEEIVEYPIGTPDDIIEGEYLAWLEAVIPDAGWKDISE